MMQILNNFWIELGIGIAIIILLSMWLLPIYEVWTSKKEGQAKLAEAQFEQQIQVAEAEGRLQAAHKNKEAAIIEAEAVAEQIKKIGTELTSHDLYLRWQWIKMMEESEAYKETIYVPTEANLPILEAGRFSHTKG